MAVTVGDWRIIPAQTLGAPPKLAPRGAELRIQGPPPSAKNTPRAESGGEPRVKLSAAGVAGRPVARVEQMSELSLSRFRRCFFSKLRLGIRASRFSPPSLGRRSDPTWRGGAKKRMLSKSSQKHAILRSFSSPFSAIFGLMLTYMLMTEWIVAAVGAALRPAAMLIADRSGVFLVCVPTPHQA